MRNGDQVSRRLRLDGKGKRRDNNTSRSGGTRKVIVRTSLSILNVTDEDSGEYTCRGVSIVGHASTKLSLTVVPREYFLVILYFNFLQNTCVPPSIERLRLSKLLNY